MSANFIKKELNRLASAESAAVQNSFFKTQTGQYGYGDIFIGVSLPNQRQIASEFINVDILEIAKLLSSEIHEHRSIALIILVNQFQNHIKKDQINKARQIVEFYLNSLQSINNWDLVDISSSQILGHYLYGVQYLNWEELKINLAFQNQTSYALEVLTWLANSSVLWLRRIAIVSTFYFIKQKDPEPTLIISKILLQDDQDLIHKAVGWMLREVGKNSGQSILEDFLNQNYQNLPRTTLRYAIEKFESATKTYYMNLNRL
jgi:3-methyladenine DNA glycosylase AlkD